MNPFKKLLVCIIRSTATSRDATALLRFILTSEQVQSPTASSSSSPSASASAAAVSASKGCGLLAQMIAYYNEVKVSGRSRLAIVGFILELCNHLRLTAALQPVFIRTVPLCLCIVFLC